MLDWKKDFNDPNDYTLKPPGKVKKKISAGINDTKLGRLSIKSRSKDSRSRRAKIGGLAMKNNKTESTKPKKRGTSKK